jgi:prepilin-type N-terminal cleavage/methylation domain-containing protein
MNLKNHSLPRSLRFRFAKPGVAFTLIELLVVIAIIATIAAFAVPAITQRPH